MVMCPVCDEMTLEPLAICSTCKKAWLEHALIADLEAKERRLRQLYEPIAGLEA